MQRIPDDPLPKTKPATPVRPAAKPEPPKPTAVQPARATSSPPKVAAAVQPKKAAGLTVDHMNQGQPERTGATLHSVQPRKASARHSGGILGDLERVVHIGSEAVTLPGKALATGERMAIDVAALVPYGVYDLAYRGLGEEHKVARKAGPAGELLRSTVGTALALLEAAGLAGDAAIDVLKGESVRDEGKRGAVNPLHSFTVLPRWLRTVGGRRYLPGIHRNGKIDWRWP